MVVRSTLSPFISDLTSISTNGRTANDKALFFLAKMGYLSIGTRWCGGSSSDYGPSTPGETGFPIGIIQGSDRDDFTLARGVNEAILAQINPNMIDPAPWRAEENQVAGAQVLPRDRLCLLELGGTGARQCNTNLVMTVIHKSTAIKASVRREPAVAVTCSHEGGGHCQYGRLCRNRGCDGVRSNGWRGVLDGHCGKITVGARWCCAAAAELHHQAHDQNDALCDR